MCSSSYSATAREFRKRRKVKNKVKSAMIYPVIVLSLAMIIMAFLFVFIVPKFESIFHDMLGDKPLPAITQFVIGISKGFMQHHWLILIGAIVAADRGPTRLSLDAHGAHGHRPGRVARTLFGDLTRKSCDLHASRVRSARS